MTKHDRMDVYNGDPEPECFGKVQGCLVAHCFWAKYCYDRAFRLSDGFKIATEK